MLRRAQRTSDAIRMLWVRRTITTFSSWPSSWLSSLPSSLSWPCCPPSSQKLSQCRPTIDMHAFRVHHNIRIDTARCEEGKRTLARDRMKRVMCAHPALLPDQWITRYFPTSTNARETAIPAFRNSCARRGAGAGFSGEEAWLRLFSARGQCRVTARPLQIKKSKVSGHHSQRPVVARSRRPLLPRPSSASGLIAHRRRRTTELRRHRNRREDPL